MRLFFLLLSFSIASAMEFTPQTTSLDINTLREVVIEHNHPGLSKDHHDWYNAVMSDKMDSSLGIYVAEDLLRYAAGLTLKQALDLHVYINKKHQDREFNTPVDLLRQWAYFVPEQVGVNDVMAEMRKAGWRFDEAVFTTLITTIRNDAKITLNPKRVGTRVIYVVHSSPFKTNRNRYKMGTITLGDASSTPPVDDGRGWFWRAPDLLAVLYDRTVVDIVGDLCRLPHAYSPELDAARDRLITFVQREGVDPRVINAIIDHFQLAFDEYHMTAHQRLVVEAVRYNSWSRYNYAASNMILVKDIVGVLPAGVTADAAFAALVDAGWKITKDEVEYTFHTVLPSLK